MNVPPTESIRRPFLARFAGLFDFTYFKTLFFILKAVLILMQVAAIISISVKFADWGSSQYYNFVAISGLLLALVLILLNFARVVEKFEKIPWNFVEIVIDAVWAIMILIASAIVTNLAKTYAGMDSYAAAAFFGYAMLVIYLADGGLRFIKLFRGERARKSASNAQATPTTGIPVY